MLGEYEKVVGCCVSTPFRSVALALQHSVSANKKYNVTEVVINDKYYVKDLFTVCHLHAEEVLFFFLFRLSTFLTLTQAVYCLASC